MNTLQPWLIAIGWTLLHSLWQLSLIAGLAAAMLAAMSRRTAQARYFVACVFLAAMFLTTVATNFYFISIMPAPIVPSAVLTPPPLPNAPFTATPYQPTFSFVTTMTRPLSFSQRFQKVTTPLLPPIAFAYLLITTLLALRLLLGYRALRRLHATAVPAPATHLALLVSLQQGLHLHRHIRLLASAAVDVPTVFFALRPLILLPATALTGLSEDHLRYLLLHELAHIRRHDYLANLAQSLIDTLLFYHPAVHWLSGIIRQEREHCCDDLTIATLGNRPTYAAALAAMETLRASLPPAHAALALAASDGSLLLRIRRILTIAAPRPIRKRFVTLTSFAAATTMLGLTLYLAACSRSDSTPTPPTTQASTSPDDNLLITTATSAPSPIRAIRAGDMLEINIYELIAPGQFYTDQLPVDEQGNLHLLDIGNVPAAGKTPRQLEDAIAHAATDGHLLQRPEVRVALMDQTADLRPLQPGDRIMSKIFELEAPGAFLSMPDVVDEAGDLNVMTLGHVHVTGLTPTAAGTTISKALVEHAILRSPAYAQITRISSATLAIAIESRIMLVDNAFFESLALPAPVDGKPATRILDGAELSDLLLQAKSNPQTTNLAAPRITLFNGQAGTIEIAPPHRPGMRLGFDATASNAEKQVIVNLGFSLLPPSGSEQTFSTQSTIPVGRYLLVASPTATDDPSGDKSGSRHVVILMGTKIIHEKKLDKLLFDNPHP